MKNKEMFRSFKINGFTVVSNGLTYDDYKLMNPNTVGDDEYFVTNKKLKLVLYCLVDKENGIIAVNDDDYNKLLELSKIKNLNKYRFSFHHITF